MASPPTHTAVAMPQTNPTHFGQFRMVIKDTRLVSDSAAQPASAVITAASVGLTKILGIVDLHAYSGNSATNTPRFVEWVPATNTLNFLANDRAVFSMASTQYAQARVGYVGY